MSGFTWHYLTPGTWLPSTTPRVISISDNFQPKELSLMAAISWNTTAELAHPLPCRFIWPFRYKEPTACCPKAWRDIHSTSACQIPGTPDALISKTANTTLHTEAKQCRLDKLAFWTNNLPVYFGNFWMLLVL